MKTLSEEHLTRPIQRILIMKVLRYLIPVAFLVVLTGLLTNLLTTYSPARVMVNLCFLFTTVLTCLFVRRGSLQQGLRVMMVGVALVFCTTVLCIGGVMSPNYLGFMLIIVTISVLSSNAKHFILAYIAYVLIGALSFLPALKLYDPPSLLSPFRVWTIDIIYGLSLTIVLYFARQARGAMHAQLSHREMQLSSIFTSISEPLIVSDLSGERVEMNPSAEALDQALFVERGCGLLLVPFLDIHSNQELTLAALIAQGDSAHRHLQVKLEVGRPAWYSVSLSRQTSSDGLPTGVVIFLRDLTDQYHLMQAQKMSAVGVLANGIAHDFNNMLGAIQNAAELLSIELEDEEQQEMVEIITEATQRSSALVSQLRQFSKMSSTSHRTLSVQELLSAVMQQLQRVASSGQQLSLALDQDELSIRGDETQLKTAVLNLGLNALQSLHGDGHVWLRAYTQELDEATCQRGPFNPRPGHFLCVEVQDDGEGIDPEVKDRIFEPFFTTKGVGKGAGLGLSTVYGAAQSHQGLVDFVSAPSEGSTFRLYLPLTTHDSSVAAQPVSRSQQQPIELKRALIIDDERLIRRSLQGMLESIGLEVRSAASGAEGLELLHAGERFDLIILDMQMPEKSGREVFYELQERYAHIPVVISSGFSPEGVIEELTAQGLMGVMSKPYRMEELKETLRRVSALKGTQA